MLLIYISSFFPNVKGTFALSKNNYDKIVGIQKDIDALGCYLAESIKTFEKFMTKSKVKGVSEYSDLNLLSKLYEDAMLIFGILKDHLKELELYNAQTSFAIFNDPEMKLIVEMQIEKCKQEYEKIIEIMNDLEIFGTFEDYEFLNDKKRFLECCRCLQDGIRHILFEAEYMSCVNDKAWEQVNDQFFLFCEEKSRIKFHLWKEICDHNFIGMDRFMSAAEKLNSSFKELLVYTSDMLEYISNIKVFIDWETARKIENEISELERVIFPIFEHKWPSEFLGQISKIVLIIRLKFSMLANCLNFIKVNLKGEDADQNVLNMKLLEIKSKIGSLLIWNGNGDEFEKFCQC